MIRWEHLRPLGLKAVYVALSRGDFLPARPYSEGSPTSSEQSDSDSEGAALFLALGKKDVEKTSAKRFAASRRLNLTVRAFTPPPEKTQSGE